MYCIKLEHLSYQDLGYELHSGLQSKIFLPFIKIICEKKYGQHYIINFQKTMLTKVCNTFWFTITNLTRKKGMKYFFCFIYKNFWITYFLLNNANKVSCCCNKIIGIAFHVRSILLSYHLRIGSKYPRKNSSRFFKANLFYN